MRDLKYLDKLISKDNQWLLFGEKSIELLRGNQVDVDIKASSIKIFSLRTAIYFNCLIKIIFIYFSQFSFRLNQKKVNSTTDHFIAELERDYRHKNYFRYINPSNKISNTLIKIFKISQYAKIKFIPFKEILKHANKNFERVFSLLSQPLTDKMFQAISINSHTNIATYSYFCALFQAIRESNPKANFYNGGGEDLSSYAAIYSGVNTHHLAHGLIDFVPMISYPHFSSCWVYSKDEGNFIRQSHKESAIHIYPSKNVQNYEKVIIIFMQYEKGLTEEMKIELSNIVKFFKSSGYAVCLKPHPDSDGSYLNIFAKKNKCKLLETTNDTTDEMLSKMNASFVAGWGSTTQCEALKAKVIPINLSHGPVQPNCRYPYHKRTLSWATDQDQIQSLIASSQNYSSVLEELSR